MTTNRFPQDLPPEGCNERVGFLIKRRCGRTTRVGCSHCDRGRQPVNSDDYYSDYDSNDSSFGSSSAWSESTETTWPAPIESEQSNCPEEFSNDFTEADAEAFTDDSCSSDFDYESDMGAS